ncbi:transmembrane protein 92 [Octodon degus]|uniref:Transmembrane protein 92 n=1 Tax=Octodon degus TaxID=10160 RepID=A0A6P6EMV3_OCTDE|nr:transmembrane protein 92 [Octodon degus]XP_023573659.1 transmembrane protein 92 [Octodon degus]
MSDGRVPGLGPTLLLTLLCGLLWTSAWETSSKAKCRFLTCPKGYECCEEGCCPKSFFMSPLRNFLICLFVIVPILCCCGMAKHFCMKRYHRALQQGQEGAHPQPPSPAATASPEEIQAAIFGPPPPYSEVFPKPTLSPPPMEPPPPYSLRPEDHTSMQGGIDNLASDLALHR